MQATGWVLDLDGVVRLGARRIIGAPEAIARLRAAGHRVVFATNNSNDTIGRVEAQLRAMGVPARGAVVTSATAAAALLAPEERVLVCGGPGVTEAVRQRGAVVVIDDGPVDTVVVGFHPTFDYERMTRATQAVLDGARLVATNDDRTYPTPDGLAPGAGAILASIVAATGADPLVAGKPHPAMAHAIASIMAGPEGAGPDPGFVVGDRADTDGALAAALGVPFVLVLSGVAGPGDEPTDPPPALVAADLAEAVAELVPTGGARTRL
jgi:4-nitrophenyl phosphatase